MGIDANDDFPKNDLLLAWEPLAEARKQPNQMLTSQYYISDNTALASCTLPAKAHLFLKNLRFMTHAKKHAATDDQVVYVSDASQRQVSQNPTANQDTNPRKHTWTPEKRGHIVTRPGAMGPCRVPKGCGSAGAEKNATKNTHGYIHTHTHNAYMYTDMSRCRSWKQTCMIPWYTVHKHATLYGRTHPLAAFLGGP